MGNKMNGNIARDSTRAGILLMVIVGALYELLYGPNRGLNIAGALVLALALFSLRRHNRVTYGVIEIGFGLFLLLYTWPEGRGAFSAGFSNGFDIWVWQLILVRTVVAVYVIIRG